MNITKLEEISNDSPIVGYFISQAIKRMAMKVCDHDEYLEGEFDKHTLYMTVDKDGLMAIAMKGDENVVKIEQQFVADGLRWVLLDAPEGSIDTVEAALSGTKYEDLIDDLLYW